MALRGVDLTFADVPRQRFDYRDRLFTSRIDPGVGYAASFWRDSAWVSLHIETDDKDLSERLFDALETDRHKIESSIDAVLHSEWDWRRHNGNRFCTINIRKDGSINDPPDQLEETTAWMLDLLPKFKEVFEPRVQELLEQLSPKPST